VAVLRGVGERPVLAVLVGAVAIAFSGILFRLSHASASTGAFYRCFLALPPLWLLARSETRRYGRPAGRATLLAWLAGAFFAADLVLWHNGIEQVGAGLATVLGNTQVVMVGLLAWAILGERPHRSSLTAIPIVAIGVLLISGVLESGAYGKNPGLGVLFGMTTAIAYSGFLLCLRQGSRDLRRPAGPLFTATLAAAIGCAAIGAVVGDLDLTPSWAALSWLLLLALSSQVVGWLLISTSLPRLPAVTSSILLTFQPVCSVIFAALIVDESPSTLQLAGAGCILLGLVTATIGRRAAPAPEPELAG
jgi:drug/metabolite transporter (DMT)-like permease